MVQGTLTSRAPKYAIICDLDRKVRCMELPSYAKQALTLTMNSNLDLASLDSDLGSTGEGPRAGLGLGETMSQFMPINYRELSMFFSSSYDPKEGFGLNMILMCGVSALLYIHRCFYAHAIETHPADPMKSQYGPSFSAGYKSACTILRSVTKQFMLFPRQIVRFWVLWTHGFSATVSTT